MGKRGKRDDVGKVFFSFSLSLSLVQSRIFLKIDATRGNFFLESSRFYAAKIFKSGETKCPYDRVYSSRMIFQRLQAPLKDEKTRDGEDVAMEMVFGP